MFCFEGRESPRRDLVIPETHERNRLFGRDRSAHIRSRDPERSLGLVGYRIANIDAILRAINLFKIDLHATRGGLFRVMHDVLDSHHCLCKNQRGDLANLGI